MYVEDSEQIQHQRQNHESQRDPLGHLGKLGVEGLGLALGKEVVGTTGDSTGETGALAGLEEDDDDEEEGSDQKRNAESDDH